MRSLFYCQGKEGMGLNNKNKVYAVKYLSYVLIILGLYVLQTTPGFLSVFGIKPNLILPAVVCIAMVEGEFIGGLMGAYGGMLLDLGGFSVFGFYSIQLMVICVAIGLLVIYLMKNNLLSAAILCGGTALFLSLTQFFFFYALWGYEDVFRLYLTKLLPTAAYSVAFLPPFFWAEHWLYQFYESKLEL